MLDIELVFTYDNPSCKLLEKTFYDHYLEHPGFHWPQIVTLELLFSTRNLQGFTVQFGFRVLELLNTLIDLENYILVLVYPSMVFLYTNTFIGDVCYKLFEMVICGNLSWSSL